MPKRTTAPTGRRASLPRHWKRSAAVTGATVVAVAVGGATSGAAAATTVSGLWHFDETSGQVAADASPSGVHGTIRGPVGLGHAGQVGTAFAFGATNAWVEVPSSAALNPGERDFRATAWIKFSKAPGTGVTYDVIRKGLAATAGGEFKLEIVSGGRAKCIGKDAARVRGAIVFPRRNLADGQWHHVGCARTGSEWQVVVDGVVKSKAVGFGSIGNAKSLAIGGQYGKEDPFPGLVDEVALSFG